MEHARLKYEIQTNTSPKAPQGSKRDPKVGEEGVSNLGRKYTKVSVWDMVDSMKSRRAPA